MDKILFIIADIVLIIFVSFIFYYSKFDLQNYRLDCMKPLFFETILLLNDNEKEILKNKINFSNYSNSEITMDDMEKVIEFILVNFESSQLTSNANCFKMLNLNASEEKKILIFINRKSAKKSNKKEWEVYHNTYNNKKL